MNDWAARTKSRYHALQISVNRPFRNDLLSKGGYSLSRAKNMADEDGRVGLDYNHPSVYDLNYALAGFDRTHISRWDSSTRCHSCAMTPARLARCSAAGT